MSSIINKIIEIDSIAQQRLNDAELLETNIKRQIEEKNHQTSAFIKGKADARVTKIDEIEQQYAAEEMAKVKEEVDSKIQSLEEIYKTTHKQLELDLFNKVIGK